MRRVKLLVIGLVVMALLMGVTCAPAPSAEKEKTINIGASVALTGPIADATNPLGVGALDYLKYVNEEMGGIQGVKLNVMWEETAYSVPKDIAAYKRLKAAGVVAIATHSTPGCEALAPSASRDKLPLINISTVGPLTYRAQPIYVVSLFQTYADQMGAWAKWLMDNWTETRPPRVGFIIVDQTNGWICVKPEPLAYIKKLGIDYLGYEVVPMALTDASIELKRLSDKNPDWVWFVHVTGGTAVLMRDAVRVGVKDKAKWADINYGLDACLLGLAPEAVEGLHIVSMFALPDDDIAGIRMAKDIARKYNHESKFGTGYINGVVQGIVTVEGIRLALEKVGNENYDSVTGADIREALMSINNFDTGGLSAPMSISPEKPFATSSFRICVAERAKKATWVSDWLEAPDVFKAARE